MVPLLKLFLIFVKIGAILIGGGYVILPIMISELCEKRNLVNKDELLDYFVLSQSLPGIIAANMSMFIGYKLRGNLGAFVAMIGVIFVPFICIITFASIIGIIASHSIIQGAFWGVGIAVIALILLTLREIWQKSETNLFFYLIFAISLIQLLYFKLSPVQTIIIMSILGLCIKSIRKKA